MVERKGFVLNGLKCFGIVCLSVSKVEVLEGSLEGKHLVITCTLSLNDQEVPTHVLINCGATGITFMDRDFACHHQIRAFEQLMEQKQVEVIDGRPIQSGEITHIAKVGMKIQDCREQLSMFVTKFRHYLIVLGIRWLCLYDVAVHFVSNTVNVGYQYCTTHSHNIRVMVQGITDDPSEPVYPRKDVFEPQIRPQQPFRENVVMLCGSSFCCTIRKGRLTVFKASLYDMNEPIEAKDLKE